MSLRGPGPGGCYLAGPFSCPCTLKCSTLYSPLHATASYQKGVVGTATSTEELLSPQEAADRLGVSVYTVRRWIKDGKLRAFRPGKEYRLREHDLEEFLRVREVRPKHISVRIADDLSIESARVEITYETFLDVLRRHGLTRRAAEEAFEEFEELQRSA
jgi:excisionase family DNA binding protein